MMKPSHIAFAIALVGTTMVGTATANDELINWMMEEEQLALDTSLQTLEPLLATSQAEAEALSAELSATLAALDSTNTDIATGQQAIVDLQAELANLAAQQAAAEEGSTVDYAALITDLEAQLAEQQANLTSLQLSAQALQTDIDNREALIQTALDLQISLQEQINLANNLYNTELSQISAQVSLLSDKQLQSLLHSMNTTNSNGIDLQLSAEQLAFLVENDYSFQKTNLYLKGYTEEAKFLSKAEALRAEAEATGNDELLKVADMMEQRATDMQNRFTDLAAGHPGRTQEQVSAAELTKAERQARGMNASSTDSPGASGSKAAANTNANKPTHSGSSNGTKPSTTGRANKASNNGKGNGKGNGKQ